MRRAAAGGWLLSEPLQPCTAGTQPAKHAPGGPKSSTPRGGWMLYDANRCGACSGSATSSRSASPCGERERGWRRMSISPPAQKLKLHAPIAPCAPHSQLPPTCLLGDAAQLPKRDASAAQACDCGTVSSHGAGVLQRAAQRFRRRRRRKCRPVSLLRIRLPASCSVVRRLALAQQPNRGAGCHGRRQCWRCCRCFTAAAAPAAAAVDSLHHKHSLLPKQGQRHEVAG